MASLMLLHSGAAAASLATSFKSLSLESSSVGQEISCSALGAYRGAFGNGARIQRHSWSKGTRGKGSICSALMDDDFEETEEEIQAGYEALYGKAFGQGFSTGKVKLGDSGEEKDGDGDDAPAPARGGRGRDRTGGKRDDRGGRGARGEFEERVVQIRRVTKVVKGGKQLSFRAVVVVGDKKGKVGVGVNKAKEVIIAVQKAVVNAKRNLISVPMNKYKTFPHRADGHYGAAHVMLRPASLGTGVIAGGAVRVVLEMAGVENALGKQIGSENPLNNARAVVEAISSMKTFRQVAEDRGIPMEELWK